MKKVVIVGAGVAGLGAGIYARISGLESVIVEKNSFVGGNLTGWERDGHAIDNCMHWLTGTHPKTELFKIWNQVGMLGERVTLCRPESFADFEHNGQRISLYRDPNKTLTKMLSISPEDARESRRFIAAVKAFGRMQSDVSRAPACLPFYLRYRSMSLGDLASRFKHNLLRRMITDLFSPELSALSLLFAYGAFCIGNADLPYGGSKAAAERMRDRYLQLGGELITDVEVEQILLRNKRAVGVRLSDETLIACDAVICACDPFVTFGRLLPDRYMPKKLRRARADVIGTPLFSAIHAAFSCDESSELPKHSTVIDCRTLDLDGRRISHLVVKPYTKSLLPQPNGRAVLQVLIFLEDRESVRWIELSRNKEAYRAAKARFGRAIEQRVLSRYPSLKSSIKLLDVWTPASYVRYFGSSNGAFMGFAMKAGHALRYRLTPRIHGLKNVRLATQWQAIPGGLPQAVLQARRAVKTLPAPGSIKIIKITPVVSEA
ncbi:MAG: NAD(P)/FAD-dependent oxidoreductase [Clostridia bacterium]|nr:NAD(P)/FAD-dependent oxidoreductase [Clostridia bacterium]